MPSKKNNVNYSSNEVLWREYTALLKERDLVWGLVDDEQGVPAGVLEEVEFLVERYEEEINTRKERRDWQEPPWQMPLHTLNETERSLLLGCDNPREFLKGCLWLVNADLQQKIQYVPPQRPTEDWEAPVWGTIKRQAITELNDGAITKEQARLLYLFRISDSWEKFHEAVWIDIGQREFYNNMRMKKKR